MTNTWDDLPLHWYPATRHTLACWDVLGTDWIIFPPVPPEDGLYVALNSQGIERRWQTLRAAVAYCLDRPGGWPVPCRADNDNQDLDRV